MYDMRKQFCDNVREKFGLNITIEKRGINGDIYNDINGDNQE